MPYRNNTSLLIDSLLRSIALGGLIATSLLAPNALKVLDKPLQDYLKKLDSKERESEMRRLLRYTGYQGLTAGNYEHGLKLTDKAIERLERVDLDNLVIAKPHKWDGQWRIVFYDIPEHKKTGRDALAAKLRNLGFYQLQRSVWVHPYPCHQEIEAVAAAYGVHSYLTLIIATNIQNQTRLLDIFADIL